MNIFSSSIELRVTKRIDIIPRIFEFFCLAHIISGSAWYWSEESGRVPVLESQLIIVPQKYIHDFAPTNEDTKMDLLFFYGSIPDSFKASGLLDNGVYSFGQSRRLRPIIELSSSIITDHKIQATMNLINLISELYFSKKNSSKSDSCSKIKDLTNLIQSKPEKWWDCQEMAEFCNLSEVQLRRLFKKETGYSPKVYLDRIKIERASELLKKNFSVGNVAELLGYSDQFHFSRRFKAITGSSPREFMS